MRPRIAFISDHASPLAVLGGVDSGGQNVYVAELAKYLALTTREYAVDVFTRWEDADVAHIVEFLPGVRVINIKAGPVSYQPKEQLLGFMDEFSENMITFIEQEGIRYELVHANFFMSALVAMRLKELLGIPYVVTYHALGKVRLLHQADQDHFPAERLDIELRTARFADKVIAECPQDCNDLMELYNIDQSKIAMAPCGFCPTEFYPINQAFARKMLKLDPDEKIILQLGRMVPRKGVDNVIRSIRLMGQTPYQVRLLVVGGESEEPDFSNGSECARLRAIAVEEGVAHQVTFIGRRSGKQLKYFYSAADVFVTTPWYEPFGITPLEAMACGTPVIGSAVGGIKYSVKDGQTGFLVPPKNPEALAVKLKQLLGDRKLIMRMQANALRRVHMQFTWSGVAEKISGIYREILEPVVTTELHTGNKALSPVFLMKKEQQPALKYKTP